MERVREKLSGGEKRAAGRKSRVHVRPLGTEASLRRWGAGSEVTERGTDPQRRPDGASGDTLCEVKNA